jgi:tetratricopeptide (TPR) repeat protein
MNCRQASLVVSCCFLLLASGRAKAQYTDDERLLSGLRAMRLYELAEDVCKNRLEASSLTPKERVTITIEQMLVLTEKGVNAPLADRPLSFAATRAIAAKFAIDHADDARGVLVRFQDALTVLTLGELQRLESELGTASSAEIETARATLREAATLLEAFDSDLQKLLPEARRAPKDAPISGEELATLRLHVGYQLARAARNQGLLYPEKSEDRTASLLRGKRQLEETVAAIGQEDPLHWLASIELATFERMLGDLARAGQVLTELEAKGPPSNSVTTLKAEQIRLLVAGGKAGVAAREGTKWADAATPRNADLDLAVFEAIAADAAAAASTDAIMEKLAEIESRHGPYWGRRASALVLKHSPDGAKMESIELLNRAAQQLFLQKNYDEAIAAFDKAAAKAKEAKKDAEFVKFSANAALVEQERKGHSEAIRRFLELAQASEAASNAAQYHLSAAWNQQQLVSAMPTDAKVFVRYEEILKDQIARFTDSPTVNKAKIWLARAYESRGEFAGAYKVADSIEPTAPERDEALLICLREWHRRSSEFDNRKVDHLKPALQWASAVEGDLSTHSQRKIRVAAIGWELLNRPKANHVEAERRLNELLEKTLPEETELIAAAKTLLVVTLAAQPEKRETAKTLLKETGGNPKQRLAAVLALVKLAKAAGMGVRESLGEFVLSAVRDLSTDLSQLSEGDKLLVDLAFAEGLAAKGDVAGADGAFAALIKKYANSAPVQEAYAEYLSNTRTMGVGGERSSKALNQWRLVASRSPPRSDRWYRAKYNVAELQFLMGDKEEAAKMIDYLNATPPGLKGAPMEAEFRALRAQIGR